MDLAYQTDTSFTSGEGNDLLEQIVREGAQKMLAAALEAEVEEFLQRKRYERGKPFRGYRNGYHEPRELTVGVGKVTVRVPRVSDVPKEVAPEGFRSQIVRRYERASRTTQRLFARLYLEGLSTGDFEPVFRELVGETTALSPNTIVRLKDEWQAEYEAWRKRRLDGHRYVYIWADGFYLGAGSEAENTALLCVLGAREDGEKELLAMMPGYRENKESWAAVLRDLRDRGLAAPLLAIGDGVLGLWAALRDVFPETKHQRCWNHRILNVLAKLPQRRQREARQRLRAMYAAPTRAECEQRRDAYVQELQRGGHRDAAETLLRDWEDFVRFYDFPKEHWPHLRTTNPIESPFAAVRLRTDVAKRMHRRENAVYLVFKIIQRLSRFWRPLNGGQTIMQLLLQGARFQDGVLQTPSSEKVTNSAA